MSKAFSEGYIAEIDGLRALAVIAVLLFHAYPSLFSGGFVGVDIFFVISGFVIARTYWNKLLTRELSLRQFYLRRVRRLAPAYVLVLFASTIAAYFLLEPKLLLNFGEALLAQPLYIQNFVFWFEGDYFDKATTRPLLHTWSLAVEEQFYLGFGLLIILLRWREKAALALIGLAFVASLALGLLLLDLSPKTSFFMLPTRIWQLVLGIFAFFVTQRMEGTWPARWDAAARNLCVALLLYAILGFSEEDSFPGPQSIISCSATFLLLVLFSKRSGKPYWLFAMQPLRRIGELSYSLYLWHWPILAFLVTRLGRELHWLEASAALLAGLVLAQLTYSFVENPIRKQAILAGPRSLLVAFVSSAALLLVLGTTLVVTKGALFRYQEPVRTLFEASMELTPFRCPKLFRIGNPDKEFCPLNEVGDNAVAAPGVLIIGDSHADMLDEMIAEIAQEYGVVAYLSVRNCTLEQFGSDTFCRTAILDKLLKEARESDVGTVIAISHWGNRKWDPKLLARAVEAIGSMEMQLVVSEAVPWGPYFNPMQRAALFLEDASSDPGHFTLADYQAQTDQQNLAIAELQKTNGKKMHTVKPSEYLCDADRCDFYTNGYPNYFDDNHLTRTGALRLRSMYERVFSHITNGSREPVFPSRKPIFP